MRPIFRYGLSISTLLIVTACGGPSATSFDSILSSTSSAPNSINAPLTPLPIEASLEGTVASGTNEQSVSWEGLTINVPPQHVWQGGPYGEGQTYNAPIIAQGRITYDVTNAPHVNELPDGIGFTIVQFAGTPQEWLAAEQQRRTGAQAIDPQTIRETTIAGQRTVAYSYVVTGVGRSETYPVTISTDRLLLIENSNADNPAYQAVVDSLSIKGQ